MKKSGLLIVASLVLTMAFMLIACSGSNYSFTQVGNKLTISAAATVNIGPDSTESLQLEESDYVLEIKAIGETKGDVVITVD